MIKRISLETIRLKLRDKIYIPVTKRPRQRLLPSTDFTIISNNCWGGTVYESYDLRKESPTVGMFIMPEDFINLASNLQHYLSQTLKFIRPEESKWLAELGGKSNWGAYPIGMVGDVELHMLHYHDETTARSKWEARVRRVNMQKIIFKLNDQNGCSEDQAQRFDNLELENKLFFTVRNIPNIGCAVRVRSPKKHEYIRASYEPVGADRSFNVNKYLASVLADA